MDFDEFDDLVNLSIESSMLKNERVEQIFTVSDFIGVSNQVFEQTFASVLIEGEISSFKVNQKKFVFFDLKDEKSSLGCFMTLWQMRFPLEDGMKVVVKAQPKLTNWGKFSLTVQQITPKGEGSLKRSFELLKKKLTDEGLFNEDKKRRLPSQPGNIGVISSTQAAGYADFIKILDERWGGMKVRVAHTQVQGLAAPDQIIRALKYFNQTEDLPEVIVIIRGGGSADDLAAFNDEALVRAIASSRVPILTGIGHETDESLADLAADIAASTPSNAAQILVPDKKSEFKAINSRIIRSGQAILRDIQLKEQAELQKISQIKDLILQKITRQTEDLVSKVRMINSYNPEIVLKRGYAIINGEIELGKIINIETRDNIISAEVKDVRKK
ncbi:exodeoxyribonuclease VII large subunit [Candidatus Saccharibacteria bacterium]|nr:exodeoxyribonuclease VII large subunit [Candidatus Saccharibacteria bacterium]MBP9489355.1 exodeoxyribonuclease VII large subunit [Candidatus Saccharibacteria bacterium]MBP9552124.1 exodeoxyribonuclease VII large subunit [Candidatus Saccharibacteria bacterium]